MEKKETKFVIKIEPNWGYWKRFRYCVTKTSVGLQRGGGYSGYSAGDGYAPFKMLATRRAAQAARYYAAHGSAKPGRVALRTRLRIRLCAVAGYLPAVVHRHRVKKFTSRRVQSQVYEYVAREA